MFAFRQVGEQGINGFVAADFALLHEGAGIVLEGGEVVGVGGLGRHGFMGGEVWGKVGLPRYALEDAGDIGAKFCPFPPEGLEQLAIAFAVGFEQALTEAIAQVEFLGFDGLQLGFASPLLFGGLDASIWRGGGRG